MARLVSSQAFVSESQNALDARHSAFLPAGMWASVVDKMEGAVTSTVEHLYQKRDLVKNMREKHDL